MLDDLRLTEFLNNEPLDLGPAARRAAGERLVDQELIRRELESTGYAKPSAADADQALRQFREQRFHFLADYRAALEKYGITEDALKQRLVWQLAALRFTDLRFRAQLPENGQSADRAAPGGAAPGSVDERMDAWLKQARTPIPKIAFKQESLSNDSAVGRSSTIVRGLGGRDCWPSPSSVGILIVRYGLVPQYGATRRS